MSQSFANINSFPIELVFGGPRKEWVWPNIPVHVEPFKGYSRFLRYPGPKDGFGYRIVRLGVLTTLRVRSLWVKPSVMTG